MGRNISQFVGRFCVYDKIDRISSTQRGQMPAQEGTCRQRAGNDKTQPGLAQDAAASFVRNFTISTHSPNTKKAKARPAAIAPA